jgi:hypothetical protein
VRISGSVTDEDGAPIAKVRVSARPMPGKVNYKALDWQLPGQRGELTDAKGRFTVTAVGEAPFLLMAVREGKDCTWARTMLVAAPTKGSQVKLRFPKKGSTISGRAVDGQGKPALGVDLIVEPDPADPGPHDHGDALLTTCKTGADGKFELSLLREGSYRLFATSSTMWHDNAGVGMPVKTGQHDLFIGMRPVYQVTGRVLGPDGKPPAAFVVESPSASDPGVSQDKDGRFSIPFRLAWKDFVVEIVAPGFATAYRRFDILPTPKDLDLGDIVLGKGRTITGHVKSDNGEPVQGVKIAVGGVKFASASPVVLSGADGSYSLPFVEDAPTFLRFVHPQFPPQERQVAPGVATVEVQFPKSGSTIVTVVDEKGTPVEGAEVDADDGSSRTTGPDGVCRFDGLTLADWGFEAWIPHRRGEKAPTARITVVKIGPDAPAKLRLVVTMAPRTVRVRALNETGSLAQALILAFPGEIPPVPTDSGWNKLLWTTPQIRGYGVRDTTEFKDLTPGKYTFFMLTRTTPRKQASKVVDVVHGGEETIDLSLTADPLVMTRGP